MQKRKRAQSKSKKRPPQKKVRFDTLDLYGAPNIKNWKMIDISENAKAIAIDLTTGASTFLNPVGGGDGISSRDGLRIHLKSITFRGQIYCNPPLAANYPNDTLSIALVYDTQPNGVLPIWSNVFLGTDSNVTALAPPNYATRQRFLILRRWCVATNFFAAANGPVYSSADPSNINFPFNLLEFHKDLKLKLNTQWTSNTGTIGNLETGGLFLLTQSSTFTTAATPWFLDYTVRTKYTDSVMSK